MKHVQYMWWHCRQPSKDLPYPHEVSEKVMNKGISSYPAITVTAEATTLNGILLVVVWCGLMARQSLAKQLCLFGHL